MTLSWPRDQFGTEVAMCRHKQDMRGVVTVCVRSRIVVRDYFARYVSLVKIQEFLGGFL